VKEQSTIILYRTTGGKDRGNVFSRSRQGLTEQEKGKNETVFSTIAEGVLKKLLRPKKGESTSYFPPGEKRERKNRSACEEKRKSVGVKPMKKRKGRGIGDTRER